MAMTPPTRLKLANRWTSIRTIKSLLPVVEVAPDGEEPRDWLEDSCPVDCDPLPPPCCPPPPCPPPCCPPPGLGEADCWAAAAAAAVPTVAPPVKVNGVKFLCTLMPTRTMVLLVSGGSASVWSTQVFWYRLFI